MHPEPSQGVLDLLRERGSLGRRVLDAALMRNDAAATAPRYGEALRFAGAKSSGPQTATELDGVGMGLALAGQHEAALEVLAAAETLRDAIGIHCHVEWWRGLVARHEALGLVTLTPKVADAARARGVARDTPTAIAYALEQAAGVSPAD